MKKFFHIWPRTGLDPESDRRDVATRILGRTVHTFKGLTVIEQRRLTDGVVGWEAIEEQRVVNCLGMTREQLDPEFLEALAARLRHEREAS